MKIIACGDSFTSGDEVLDDVLYPNFPGYRSDTHQNAQACMKWHLSTKKKRHANYDNIVAREQELAFPSVLGKILGYDMVNLGVSGCSQQVITNDVIRNVMEAEDCVVTMNITGPNRIMFPYDNQWNSVILGHANPDIHNSAFTSVDRIFTLNTTDLMLHEMHAIYILNAINFLRSRSIKFVLIDSVFMTGIHNFLISNEVSYFVIKCWQEIEEQSGGIISMTDVIRDKHIQDAYCPGGHFSKEVHSIFGAVLADRLAKL